eukprot:g16153.t1
MQNLDGQMEIVTGLIHRMDAMGRFLQHIQNGMRGEEICCVTCSRDGQFLAAACASGQVYLFYCEEGRLKPLALAIAGWLGPEEVRALDFCKAPSGLQATAGCKELLVVLLVGRLRHCFLGLVTLFAGR